MPAAITYPEIMLAVFVIWFLLLTPGKKAVRGKGEKKDEEGTNRHQGVLRKCRFVSQGYI